MMPRVRRARCWRGRCGDDLCCFRMPLLALAVLLFFVCIITLLLFAIFATVVVMLQKLHAYGSLIRMLPVLVLWLVLRWFSFV